MLTETQNQDLQVLLADMKQVQGALLPILHAVQERLGYVPPAAVGEIAAALNLSRAEVHGVISFYHHFRSEPAARNHLQICRAEACLAMGGEALWQHACHQLDLPATQSKSAHGASRSDGAVSLQPVYCLGMCSASPALLLNDKLHARVDAKKFDLLVANIKNQVAAKVGSES